MYEAARVLYSSISNFPKLAITLEHIRELQLVAGLVAELVAELVDKVTSSKRSAEEEEEGFVAKKRRSTGAAAFDFTVLASKKRLHR